MVASRVVHNKVKSLQERGVSSLFDCFKRPCTEYRLRDLSSKSRRRGFVYLFSWLLIHLTILMVDFLKSNTRRKPRAASTNLV